MHSNTPKIVYITEILLKSRKFYKKQKMEIVKIISKAQKFYNGVEIDCFYNNNQIYEAENAQMFFLPSKSFWNLSLRVKH